MVEPQIIDTHVHAQLSGVTYHKPVVILLVVGSHVRFSFVYALLQATNIQAVKEFVESLAEFSCFFGVVLPFSDECIRNSVAQYLPCCYAKLY